MVDKQQWFEVFCSRNKRFINFCDKNKEKKERINSNTYINILGRNLLPFQQAVHELAGGSIVFQQDNAPIHTSRVTTE